MMGSIVLGLVWVALAAPSAARAADSRTTATSPDPVRQALRYYTRGRFLADEGEPALAAREFRRAAALAPQAVRIRESLGVALYEAGNVADAAEALDEALRLDPDRPSSLYVRGRVARSLNRPDEAVHFFTRAIEADSAEVSPHGILARYYLARINQERGNVDEAIAHYAVLLDQIAIPRAFFRRYPEIYLLYQGRMQLERVLGRLYLLRGDNDEAIARFQAALAERPQHPELLGLLCRAYLQKKDYAGARAWARQLIKVQPDGQDGYRRLAETYQAEGNLDDAVADLEALRRETPENQTVALELAALYETVGRQPEAVALYAELATSDAAGDGPSVSAATRLADLHLAEGRPLEAIEALAGAISGRRNETALLVRATKIVDGLDDPDAVYQRAREGIDAIDDYGTAIVIGMLAERVEEREDAIRLYEKAIAREPLAPLAYSRKADLLIRENRLEDALEVYRAAVKAGLGLPSFHRKIGMILDRLGRLEEAVAAYRLARAAAPDDRPTRHFLAAALARLGRLNEAEAELNAMIERFLPDAQTYCQLAAVALAQNDLLKAEAAAERAQRIDPEGSTPRALVVEIRLRQKRFDEAERMARVLLAEDAGDNEARLLLAHALAAQKRWAEATAEVRTLLATEPGNIAWHYLLAGLTNEMGDPAASEAELLKILQIQPDFAPANNDLGYLWADRGIHLKRAEQMIRLALGDEPENAAYMDSLGWVLYKRGNFEEAVGMLEAAAEKMPDADSVIWDHLGDAYWRLSHTDQAAEAWQKAVDILQKRVDRPKPDELKRLRRKMEVLRAGTAPEVAPLAEADQLEDDLSTPETEP